tara:strand:+ start:1896 stop:4310 length:2415 start_codon:yes stop_codon:yes gene_type:complete
MALGLGSKLTKGGVDPYSMYRSRNCVRFDGTDDHLQISDSTTFDHVSTDSQFTIACWFKTDGLSIQNQALMSKFNGTGSKREWLLYLTSSNKMYLALSSNGEFETDGGGDDTGVHNRMKKADDSADWLLEDTKWHHVMVSYNGSAGPEINWFLDGQAMQNNDDDELDNGNFAALHQADHPVMIGGYGANGTSYPMLGYIADPIYINRLVGSLKHATAMYNNGKPRNLSRYVGYSASMVKAYWQMGDNKDDAFESAASGITYDSASDKGFIVDASNTKTLTVDKTQGRGQFDSDTGWILTTEFDSDSIATISGGILTIKQTTNSRYVKAQLTTNADGTAIFEVGKLYEVTAVVSDATAGTIRIMPTGSGGNQTYSTLSALGTYKMYFIGTSGYDKLTVARNATNGTNMQVSSITVREIDSSDYAVFKNMAKGIVAESPGIGRDSYSYLFDGANDYVDVGPSNGLITGNTVTVAFWAKVTDTHRTYVFANARGDGQSNFAVALNQNGTTLSAGVITGLVWTGSAIATVSYDGNIDDSAWHHYAFTTTASAQVLYLDGVAVATGSNTFSNAAHADHNTHIGNLKGGGYYLGGNISDMVVFNSTLTAAQVRENMGPGLDLNNLSTEANIVAWWRFGDGTLDYKGTTHAWEGCLGDENNPTLGADILGGKGDFSDSSYWSITGGQTIVEGGKGKWLGNGSYGNIMKSGILTAGKIYEVILDVDSNVGSGSNRLNLNFSDVTYPYLIQNGESGKGFKSYFQAEDTDFIIYCPDYTAKITIDNLTVRLVNGIPGVMRHMQTDGYDIVIDAP